MLRVEIQGLRAFAVLVCAVSILGAVLTTTAGAAPANDLRTLAFSSPREVAAGGQFSLVVQVTNVGPDPATGVKVVNTLPAGSTFVSVQQVGGPPVNCSEAEGVVTCTIGSAFSATILFGLLITAPSSPGTITNVVSVSGNEPDIDLSNNTSQAETVVGNVDLQLRLPNYPPVGDDDVLFGVTVHNAGPDSANEAVLRVQLPAVYSLAGFVVTEGTAVCTEAAALVTCVLGPIAVAGDARLQLRAVTASPPTEPFDVAYSVWSAMPDNAPGDNTAVQTVPVDQVVSIGDASAYEGDTGKTLVKLPVRLAEPSNTEIAISYRIQGDPADVNDRGGRVGTIRFRPSAKTGLTPVTKYITVALRPDVIEELDETFQVVLSNPTGDVVIGDGVGVGTITNDDVQSGQRIGIGDITFREGDEGLVRASLVVTLSEPATVVVTATATTVAIGSVAGVDFKPLTKVLTFLPGQQRKVVTVTLYPDRIDDGNNRTGIALSGVVGATVEGRGSGTITTMADD